jgi:hypothetical protein
MTKVHPILVWFRGVKLSLALTDQTCRNGANDSKSLLGLLTRWIFFTASLALRYLVERIANNG